MSHSSPWLSLLVPAHNIASYLEQCLQSIESQLQAGVEIVVLDDASTDDCADVVARAQARLGGALRHVVHPANLGIAAVRNRLLREAAGRYLWFVDGDDELCPGALQALAETLAEDAPDLVMCDFRVLRERSGLKHRLRGERHRRSFRGPSQQAAAERSSLVAGLLLAGQLHCWSKIAKREVWQQVVFPEGRYFEDLAITAQLVAAVRSYRHVAQPWLAYRQRAGSILAEYTAQKMRHLALALSDLHSELADGPPLDPAATFALEHFCLKTHASMARRLARGGLADADGLAEALHASLRCIFPDGFDAILRAYVRRGWVLRAQRARASLRQVGFA